MTLESYFAAAVRRALTPFSRKSAIWRVAPLVNHENHSLKGIGLALRDTASGLATDEERKSIDEIEQRRKSLLESKEMIEVIDFGAGAPDSKRTELEMSRGVRSFQEVGRVCRVSKPMFWSTFMFHLVRRLRPKSCVELGTAVGISASYLASALQLNGEGRLSTLEGSPGIAEVAQETVHALGLQNVSLVVGPFHQTLSSALDEAEPVDFLFNDGHHDRNAVLRYFDLCQASLAPEAVILIDDINWSAGMREAWAEVTRDDRSTYTIDLGVMGVVVKLDRVRKREHFRIPLF